MIRIEFSEDEIERLRRKRFGHPYPRVQRKLEALLLKSGFVEDFVAEITLKVCHNKARRRAVHAGLLKNYRRNPNGVLQRYFSMAGLPQPKEFPFIDDEIAQENKKSIVSST